MAVPPHPPVSAPDDVTDLLRQWRAGDEEAFRRLVATLYGLLKGMAHARLLGERTDHTLNTTALVHEAYLRLQGSHHIEWQDRAHFLAVISRVMRRVLIDYARRRRAAKRGAGLRTTFTEAQHPAPDATETLLELHDVLERLEASHPRPARAIELYYLGGLTQQEVARVLEVSQPTVVRDLQFGQAWLARAWQGNLTAFGQPGPPSGDAPEEEAGSSHDG